ncbi:MAG: lipoprotein [Pseudomonadota bacterium]|jgi:predicted small lipoprotein YifL|uniref:LPS translocon maturation chaperone LptM n=1 Tax=Alcanivorax sp. TaxID=1872427 RepID=UPI002438B761|nr:lipoprotein [Alcanivorax sp.]MEE3319881.1 lipoprotein [Pseudomonadota bacterium]
MRLSALCLLALLAGCGQKGPLYFAPDETEQPATSQPAPDTADDTQQDDEQD